MDKTVDRVGGELRAVKGCRWKSAERLRERRRGDGAGFGRRAAEELLRQEGGASDRSSAAAAKEARVSNAPLREAHREPQDVPTNGITYLHRCRGAGQLPGITRVSEMIENGFAEHF